MVQTALSALFLSKITGVVVRGFRSSSVSFCLICSAMFVFVFVL